NWQAWQQRANRYRIVVGQPGWVTKIALACMALVIAVPLILLVLAAIFIGVVVFVALAIIAKLVQMMQALLAGTAAGQPDASINDMPDDGRRNVRVIRR